MLNLLATLLQKAFSLVETLVSVTLLMIISLVFIGVNKMQGDQARLEELSSDDGKRKVLVTKSV